MGDADRSRRRFVPLRTGETGPLGQLESLVMETIWGLSDEVSVGDVVDALACHGSVAYNTVKTTMERLASKGILRRSRSGKAYRYGPLVSRQCLERRIVAGALGRLVEQFPEAVASFFVHPDPQVSDEKLALLQHAIERSGEAEND